jgi:acyl-[acyl-carrier-protein]-phospholipid O-acyltransferase/long-chain-fatty-acid--[acyl-carrier-protein] ligase
MLKRCLRWLLSLCYRVEVEGLEHYKAAGERVLIIANHTSFLDAALLAAYLPDTLSFAVNTEISRRWWVRPFLLLVDAFAVDPLSPMATRTMIEKLKENKRCVIFPEGRITVTGALMKIYEGPGMIADKAGAKILPVRIDGAQYTPFSRLRGKLRLRAFPRIRLTILQPCQFSVDAALRGRARRAAIGRTLYDVMSRMVFETSPMQRTLFDALIEAMQSHGRWQTVAEDIERAPMHYHRLLTRSFLLGQRMASGTREGEAVGLMLPNSLAVVVSFFALQAYGRVPAMLNFSTGAEPLRACCRAAQVRRVYTSRKFIAQAKLEGLVEALVAEGLAVHYLEDLRRGITVFDLLGAAVCSFMAPLVYPRLQARTPDDTAVILFTSGSEGTPKGVALSHINLLANLYQVAARVDFSAADTVFNVLPVFHSFGLTHGTLLPVLSGIRTFFYPSPLHYRIVPELIYDTNATILFGTDTFLSGYAKYANAYDFYSLRYVFAGAERLKETTRATWADKFGIRIFEGYGATECAPVIAVNTPMHHQPGTVGRLLPGMMARLEAVEGTDGGRLWVWGPNVMRGYLRAENPGTLQPTTDGWYDTGDIVTLDDEGYVKILGRAKRFAKIGGEMISLAAIERWISMRYPDVHHAAISLPDERKGEQIILLTEQAGLPRSELVESARAHGLSELAVPRQVLHVAKLPWLATGKADYPAITALAKAQLDTSSAA